MFKNTFLYNKYTDGVVDKLNNALVKGLGRANSLKAM